MNHRLRVIVDWVLLVSCITGAVWFWHSKSVREKAQALYYQAKTLDSQSKYDEAAVVLQKSIRLNPRSGKAHCLLGAVYHSQKNFLPAAGEFKEALKYKMDSENEAIAHFNLATVYLEALELPTAAVSEYHAAIKSYPQLTDHGYNPHVGLAKAYMELKRIDDAIAEALKSLTINPSNTESHVILGFAYLSKKDFVAAQRICGQLKNIDTKAAQSLFDAVELFQGALPGEDALHRERLQAP